MKGIGRVLDYLCSTEVFRRVFEVSMVKIVSWKVLITFISQNGGLGRFYGQKSSREPY